jgi:DNA-binding SARP family transcriptional activator
MDTAMKNSIRLLGPVVVEVDGYRVTGFRSLKTVALLAFLVAEQRAISRDYLAALFWPDAPQTAARGHLRRALHDLVNKIPGCLESDYYIVQFASGGGFETDLALLDSLRAKGKLPGLEQATEMACGEFLEGIYLDDCPEFEMWLLARRESYRNQVVSLLETLLHRLVQSGRSNAAMEVAWQLLRLEPWSEEIHRQLMLLLAHSGRREAALRQYHLCRKILAEELDIEPSAETTALYQRIWRSSDTPSPRPQSHYAPLSFPGYEPAVVALAG